MSKPFAGTKGTAKGTPWGFSQGMKDSSTGDKLGSYQNPFIRKANEAQELMVGKGGKCLVWEE